MSKPLLVLLGSGASPAPNVQSLTDRILHVPMYWHSSGRWVPVKTAEFSFGTLEKVVPRFLEALRELVALRQDRPLLSVSYEDIGAVCVELWRSRGTRRNPLACLAIAQLEEQFGADAARALASSDLTPRSAFYRLVEDTLRWIHCSVVHALSETPSEGTAVLERLFGGFFGRRRSWVVATLNHDLWIERALRRSGISFSDGFERTGGIRTFFPRRLRHPRSLLKLHGGIDWCRHPDHRTIVRVVDGSHHAAVYASIDHEFLVGTHTKIESYSQGVFPKLFAAFDRALESAPAVVVCGYGFQDAGVNSRLIWERVYSPGMRFIIVHPDCSALISQASGHAQQFLEQLPADAWIHRTIQQLVEDDGMRELAGRLT